MDPIPFQLIPYSSNDDQPCSTIHISGNIMRHQNQLICHYLVSGNLDTIAWPAQAIPANAGEELWRHTCLELFVADRENPAYWEYNFSPSQRWAMYRFSNYRQPQTAPRLNDLKIQSQFVSPEGYSLQVNVPIPAELRQCQLDIGVSAVIELKSSDYCYFALRHCGDKPDFHLRNSFTLTMAPASQD